MHNLSLIPLRAASCAIREPVPLAKVLPDDLSNPWRETACRIADRLDHERLPQAALGTNRKKDCRGDAKREKRVLVRFDRGFDPLVADKLDIRGPAPRCCGSCGSGGTTAAIRCSRPWWPRSSRRKWSRHVRFDTEVGEQMQVHWAVIRRGSNWLSVFVATLGYQSEIVPATL